MFELQISKLKNITTMAIIRDPFFEKLSGRLGDYVFKQMNGKTFVYYRPKAEKENNKRAVPQENPISFLGSLAKKYKQS
jgi:hypothetical protein